LILEERDYHMWKLSLELGGGVKSGQIALILPVIGRADTVAQAPQKAAQIHRGRAAEMARCMGRCNWRGAFRLRPF
jgi:hypothetical protein